MKSKMFMRAGAGCVGLVAGLCVAVGPAVAKAPASIASGYHPAHPLSAPLGTVHPDTGSVSAYYGGYNVGDSGSLSVTSTIQLPSAKCANRNDQEDVFLGEELVPAGGDSYAGGTNDGSADVIMYCDGSSATPTYLLEAYTVSGGDEYGTVANPGDLVQFTYSDAYGGTDTATTTDLNTGESESSSGDSTGDDTQLYLGVTPNVGYEEAGSVVDLAIPKFTTLKFDNAIINGRQWTTNHPAVVSLEQNSDVQIKPAAVPTKATYNFTLTEQHTS